MTTHKSDTPKDERDLWRTPPQVFEQLRAEFNFVLDAAASQHNALLPFFYDENINALAQHWPPVAIWCNPPYSDPMPWVLKAAEAAEDGATVVMLLNIDPSVRWFAEAWATIDELRLISGRLSFIGSNGVKKNANNKPQALLIWRPGIRRQKVVLVDRGSLSCS